MSARLLAQDNKPLKIVTPFESLQINDVTLTGNQLKRSVTIGIKFKNLYPKRATVHFNFGEFEEFGIVDGNGNKYKIYTREDLTGTSNINKGFRNISSVAFGSKKLDYFTYLRQDLNIGEEKTLLVVINGVDKNLEKLQDFHIKCRLLFSGIIKGEGVYRIEGLKINWGQPEAKTKGLSK